MLLFVDQQWSLALDHQIWTEVNISVLKQNKLTLWGFGEEISGNGILTIGKWEFTILQNGMVSYTYKLRIFCRGPLEDEKIVHMNYLSIHFLLFCFIYLIYLYFIMYQNLAQGTKISYSWIKLGKEPFRLQDQNRAAKISNQQQTMISCMMWYQFTDDMISSNHDIIGTEIS